MTVCRETHAREGWVLETATLVIGQEARCKPNAKETSMLQSYNYHYLVTI